MALHRVKRRRRLKPTTAQALGCSPDAPTDRERVLIQRTPAELASVHEGRVKLDSALRFIYPTIDITHCGTRFLLGPITMPLNA